MQPVDERGNADHDGEKGEDEKVGQLGGGPADPLGKVHIHHVRGEADGRMGAQELVQLVFHDAPLQWFNRESIPEAEGNDNRK